MFVWEWPLLWPRKTGKWAGTTNWLLGTRTMDLEFSSTPELGSRVQLNTRVPAFGSLSWLFWRAVPSSELYGCNWNAVHLGRGQKRWLERLLMGVKAYRLRRDWLLPWSPTLPHTFLCVPRQCFRKRKWTTFSQTLSCWSITQGSNSSDHILWLVPYTVPITHTSAVQYILTPEKPVNSNPNPPYKCVRASRTGLTSPALEIKSCTVGNTNQVCILK